MTVKEIADRIDAHLKRFESDPRINRKTRENTSLYWQARAWSSGRFVRVLYVNYQGSTAVSKADAEKYLAWLDAGNEGQHFKALRAMKRRTDTD